MFFKGNIKFINFSLIIFLWAFSPNLFAQELLKVPALTQRVLDFTNTLPQKDQEQITTKLAEIEKKIGSQIVVLLVATTKPEDIASYSFRVADTWKIGRKNVGDGLLIIVAKEDRQMRIEVARTLEGAIPDVMAYRIINEIMKPAFRQNDFGGGIFSAINAIEKLIAGEGLPEPTEENIQNTTEDSLMVLLFGLIISALVLTGIFGRGLAFVGNGAIAGFAINSMFNTTVFTIVAVIIGAIIALVIGIISKSGGLSSINNRQSGRNNISWGGGGSSGGFSSGGGGSFGGGGASGNW